jgi:hypothetical protein
MLERIMKYLVIARLFVRSFPAIKAIEQHFHFSIPQIHQDNRSIKPCFMYGNVQHRPDRGEIRA